MTALALMGSALAPAVMPHLTKNLTVYHLNPLSSIGDGTPTDMNTADAAGDLFFALWESYLYPVACPYGNQSSGQMCKNQEVARKAKDLVVTKLELAVVPEFGEYARCNLCYDGTDGHGNPCKDGTYFCEGGDNFTVGYENVTEHFQEPYEVQDRCGDYMDDQAECWEAKAAFKLDLEHPGAWYSTEAGGQCRNQPSKDKCHDLEPAYVDLDDMDPFFKEYSTKTHTECCDYCGKKTGEGLKNCSSWRWTPTPDQGHKSCQLSSLPPTYYHPDPGTDTYGARSGDCTWEVVEVVKAVDFACHSKYFLGGIEKASSAEDKACFRSCGGIPGISRNESDPCWVRCFYGAMYGPNVNKSTTEVTGVPLDTVLELFDKPLHKTFIECPNMLK